MSQQEGFLYMIKRDGQRGERGNVVAAFQITENSPLREWCLKQDFYIGSKEEWEEYSHALAGDLDGDGDVDVVDRVLRDEVTDSNSEEASPDEDLLDE